MQKERPALRILGERVRYYRKLKGMSQAELARGICTQATISLIEKRNKVPSMNILVRLVERLGVVMADIVVEHQDKTQQILSRGEDRIRHNDYEQAVTELDQIELARLHSEVDKRRYYYLKGMVELVHHQAPDEAIYYFGRVLNPMTHRERNLLAIMATLGLGLAYAEKDAQERARVYIEQALHWLQALPLKEAKHLDTELTIYWHTARIYYDLGEFKQVLKYVSLGIDAAVDHDSLFLLDELYTLRAQALQALGDSQANATYMIAQALAKVNRSAGLEARIASATESA